MNKHIIYEYISYVYIQNQKECCIGKKIWKVLSLLDISDLMNARYPRIRPYSYTLYPILWKEKGSVLTLLSMSVRRICIRLVRSHPMVIKFGWFLQFLCTVQSIWRLHLWGKSSVLCWTNEVPSTELFFFYGSLWPNLFPLLWFLCLCVCFNSIFQVKHGWTL